MKLRYTRQAVADLFGIGDYIRARNPAAAVNVETAILGRNRPGLDARALGVPRYPYTAYYWIEGDEIWIVHIRDDRREPPDRRDL